MAESKVRVFVLDGQNQIANVGSDTLTALFKDPSLIGKSLRFDILQPDGLRKTVGSYVVQGSVVIPSCTDPNSHFDTVQNKCVCNEGFSLVNGVCTKDVVIPQPTDPKILWTSKGIWDNQLDVETVNGVTKVVGRTVTAHHGFDPYDKLTEVAAGENRKWFISGLGYSLLSGARARIYNHVKQLAGKKYQWDITYVNSSTLDNFSLQFFSRHNEPDPTNNRYGGPTFAIHDGSIEFDEEFWHNERDQALSDSKTLAQQLLNDKTYSIRVIGEKIVASSTDVRFNFNINIDYGTGFVNVWNKSFKTNHPDAALKEALYWRMRTNGSAPKDVKILEATVRQL